MRKLLSWVGAGFSAGLVFACSGGNNKDNDLLFETKDDHVLLGSYAHSSMAGASGVAGDSNAGASNAGAGGTAASGGSGGSAGGADDHAAEKADPTLVWKSSGCGKELPADQVVAIPGSRVGYTKYTVMETGETISGTDPTRAVPRDIYVRVPADYDPNRAYRVVYIGQGCGGGSGDQSTYPLFDESKGGDEQAIYVGISLPPPQFNGACYDNRAGEASLEWEAFQVFHTLVESTYCADNNRIFVSGYSTGGWLANMWGCYFGGYPSDGPRKFAPEWRIRGQAGTTGCQPDNIGQLCADTDHKVAALWLHDVNDPANPYACNHEVSLPRVFADNGCTGTLATAPTEPWGAGTLAQICLRYTSCPENYPVIFCTTQGNGHADQPANSIPAFTQFYHLFDPAP